MTHLAELAQMGGPSSDAPWGVWLSVLGVAVAAIAILVNVALARWRRAVDVADVEREEMREVLKLGEDIAYFVVRQGPHTTSELTDAGIDRLARDADQLAERAPLAFQPGFRRVADISDKIMASGLPSSRSDQSTGRLAVLQDRSAHELASEIRQIWSLLRSAR
jgi:hypothetical protein